MAKQKLIEMTFETLPDKEVILKEGLLQTMSLFGNKTRFTFKYLITGNGIWVKNKGGWLRKSREFFLAYSEIKQYKKAQYFNHDCYIFYNKNGKRPGNRIFFDDTQAVEKYLIEYLNKV